MTKANRKLLFFHPLCLLACEIHPYLLIVLFTNMSSILASLEPDDDGEMFIRVIAPATLREGYSFDVLVDGKPYTVHVPPGGVKEGQEFDVLYDREEEDSYVNEKDTLPAPSRTMSSSDDDDVVGDKDEESKVTWFDEATGAPIGRWRTSLCSCCDVVTQSTFWMATCCTPVLIAQLIHRFHLTWNGQAGDVQETQLSYNRLVIGMIVALGIWKIPALGDMVLVAYWFFVVAYIGTNLRAHVRQKYKIPSTLPNSCARYDDACCMILCGCCSSIQIARHTHDDKEYPGHACTQSGLGFDAPRIVENI